jgi:hypothetical protein
MMPVRIYTILLAALIGLSGFQLAEAKTQHPKPQHSSSRKVKNKKVKKTKVKHHKALA